MAKKNDEQVTDKARPMTHEFVQVPNIRRVLRDAEYHGEAAEIPDAEVQRVEIVSTSEPKAAKKEGK